MAKILVIEDDAMVRRVIVDLLTDAGHTVATAENGRQGIALFRSEAPDLVVTDIIMPEQGGIETLKQIREIRPDAKVIVVSGGGCVGNTDVLEMARALGAANVLAKPFYLADFMRSVSRCLASG